MGSFVLAQNDFLHIKAVLNFLGFPSGFRASNLRIKDKSLQSN